MYYYVYLIKAINVGVNKSYVGYTNNLKMRIIKHNSNKGAKSTKGHKWEVIYKKKFVNKSDALKYEYNLKKNRKERLNIIKKNT